MNIKNFLTDLIVAGKPRFPNSPGSAVRWILWVLLFGLSFGYHGILSLRVWLYRKHILKQTTLPCPVISIGNITTGGTGKTPMVMFIADVLRQQSKRVVILSRGYHRKSGGSQIVNSDDDVREVGDEPLLIARSLAQSQQPGWPDVTVIVDRQRARAGQLAIDHCQPDVILLDDGFQHLPLARSCDLVLIDATQPFGGGALLPAGLLREPLSQLRRAHVFVITRSNEVADLVPIQQQLYVINPTAPIFMAMVELIGLRQAATGETVALDDLCGKRLLSVCGLGNPASFQRVLKASGLTVARALDFPDHHWYTAADAMAIRQTMQTGQIDAILTTAKDEAKLYQPCRQLNLPLYTVITSMAIRPEAEFVEWLRHVTRQKHFSSQS